MPSNLEERVVKLEYITEGHGEELTELKDTSDELRKTLHSIQTTLSQIKWIAMGAGAMYILNVLGVSEFLSLIM